MCQIINSILLLAPMLSHAMTYSCVSIQCYWECIFLWHIGFTLRRRCHQMEASGLQSDAHCAKKLTCVSCGCVQVEALTNNLIGTTTPCRIMALSLVWGFYSLNVTLKNCCFIYGWARFQPMIHTYTENERRPQSQSIVTERRWLVFPFLYMYDAKIW